MAQPGDLHWSKTYLPSLRYDFSGVWAVWLTGVMAGFTMAKVSFLMDFGQSYRKIGKLTTIGLRASRGAHTHPITKNISYISNEKLHLNTDVKTLQLSRDLARPLCVMLTWLLPKSRHTLKYADIYLDQGYDVIRVNCSPLQLMWPTKGSQVIAVDLLKLLEVNEDHNPLVVHGFSVGAYVWAELLVHAFKDLERYKPVLDRVAAQVWDSPTDVDELPVGLTLALFPNNKPLQKALSIYAKAHLKAFYNIATRHYLAATAAYHNTPCRAPTLFLLSRTDPIGAERRSRKAHEMMTAAGIKCNWQCWDESPHVQHYNRHPQEYLAALHSHLEECGLLQPEKARMATSMT